MKNILLAAAVFAASTASVCASETYDRRIEAAAMKIVAGKIGDIRGTFAPGDQPVFVTVDRTETTGAVRRRDRSWNRGITRAREPFPVNVASF